MARRLFCVDQEVKNMKNDICTMLNSMNANKAFEYSIKVDKNFFGNIVLDIMFENLSVKCIKSNNEFEMYICSQKRYEYTYTLKEIATILKLKMPDAKKEYIIFLRESLQLIIDNFQKVADLFVFKNNKPLIDQYVYKSNRVSIWHLE